MSRNITYTTVRALVLVVVFSPAVTSGKASIAHAQGIQKVYEENSVVPVVTFMASDEEGTVLAWFLTGVDGGDFSIDDGSLQFRRTPDFENPVDANRDNFYEVSVNVTDGTNTTTADLSVRVTNIDEAGTVHMSSLQPEVGIALTATLADPDGGLAGVTWNWERSADQTDWEDMADAAAEIYTPTRGDVGKYLRVTAAYDDGEGPGKSAQVVSYSVVRESHPPGHGPEFPADELGVRSVTENSPPGTAIGPPIAGIDEEGHVLTHTLNGADAETFDIERSTGQLLTKAPLDYETRRIYSFALLVTDPTNASDSIAVTVDVINVEEAGAITLSTPQPFAGRELVAHLDDPDGGISDVTWLWEKSEDNMQWDEIDGTDSETYTPIGEDESNYLRVTASYSDGEGSGKTAQAVSLNTVRALVDHRPVFSSAETGVRSIEENTPPGAPIGEPFMATDEEGHTLTFLLLDEFDADTFDLDSSSGQLLTKEPLDYETKNIYQLTVAVHDSDDEGSGHDHSLDATLAVTVLVIDVDEESVEYTMISSGANHICALTADGSITCWGNDDFGQVSGRPTAGRFLSVSGGDNHTCALRDDGAIVCWGSFSLNSP